MHIAPAGCSSLQLLHLSLVPNSTTHPPLHFLPLPILSSVLVFILPLFLAPHRLLTLSLTTNLCSPNNSCWTMYLLWIPHNLLKVLFLTILQMHHMNFLSCSSFWCEVVSNNSKYTKLPFKYENWSSHGDLSTICQFFHLTESCSHTVSSLQHHSWLPIFSSPQRSQCTVLDKGPLIVY